MSPGELIKDIRLEKAATMLSEGKMRINEIKDMVGYSSSSYFAKNFLKNTVCFQKTTLKSNEYEKAIKRTSVQYGSGSIIWNLFQ